MNYTRLEKQIEKMEKELALFKATSSQLLKKFEEHQALILQIVKPYGIKKLDTTNTYLEKSAYDGNFRLRVYLEVDFQLLSERQKRNVEKKLREADIPMPICPITSNKISLVYL